MPSSVHRVNRLRAVLLAALIGCGLSSPAGAQTLEIRLYTVDGGGGTTSTGGVFSVGGTIGQPDSGAPMNGGVFTVNGGFWGSAIASVHADLVIVKSDSADPVLPGTTFSYQLAVSNTGPGPASDLVVSDTLPTEVAFVSVSGANWSCSETGGVITCTLPGLSPGDAPVIVIDVTAPGGGATLSNTAEVSTSATDPITANNTDGETTGVLAAADLSISNWGDPGPVPPGAPVSYILDVTNTGPDAAASVTVEDTLPTGSMFQSASGNDWTCGESGGVVTCTLGSVASGTAADPITVVITPPDVSGLMTNWSYVDSSTYDPVTANNSDPATTEVDATPPQVVLVGSAADTGNGRIDAGESTRTAITQITTIFSEQVADPPGDTDPDDVTNPANYLLLASGGDGLFATTDCAGGVDPSDLQVPVDQVFFDEPSTTAFVLLAGGGASLPMERYRLLVCGSTSIVDLVGQALDGDGDGAGGDDHALDFTVLSSNLLLNPNFDGDLGHWTVTSPAPGEINHAWQDADGIATSGAARIVNTSGPGGLFTLQQCVSTAAGQFHRLGALIRTAGTTPGAPIATGVVDFFTGVDCSGSVAASLPTGTITGDTAGLWENDLGGLVQAPAGTQSASVRLVLDAGASPDFTTDIDNTHFFDSGFFADDFESGDTSGWSNATGGTP